MNGALERLIRACPDQYFWLHDRYRGTSSADVAVASGEVSEEPMG
ncbi:MAG: hypothetical protein U0802_11885 [Candidatus Binatia bacterium]